MNTVVLGDNNKTSSWAQLLMEFESIKSTQNIQSIASLLGTLN